LCGTEPAIGEALPVSVVKAFAALFLEAAFEARRLYRFISEENTREVSQLSPI
jgi:hypothetical protein